MSMNVSEFVWHRLREWGLGRVYGYPGDGVGGLDVALDCRERSQRSGELAQCRSERGAGIGRHCPRSSRRAPRFTLRSEHPDAVTGDTGH